MEYLGMQIRHTKVLHAYLPFITDYLNIDNRSVRKIKQHSNLVTGIGVSEDVSYRMLPQLKFISRFLNKSDFFQIFIHIFIYSDIFQSIRSIFNLMYISCKPWNQHSLSSKVCPFNWIKRGAVQSTIQNYSSAFWTNYNSMYVGRVKKLLVFHLSSIKKISPVSVYIYLYFYLFIYQIILFI